MSREEYVKKYGHRGPHEVELHIPRPAEDPNWIDKQLENLKLSTMVVDTLLQEQRTRYEIALGNLRKIASRKFDPLLQRIQEAARLTRIREAVCSEGRTFGTNMMEAALTAYAGKGRPLGDDELNDLIDDLELRPTVTTLNP